MTDRATITRTVPEHFGDSLRKLLADEARLHPQLTSREDGKRPLVTFTISGPSDVMATLAPKLDAWEADEMSREAW